MQTKKVIIVGGGIAGMSAAHELLQCNTERVQFDIHVYEKDPQYVGGKARSIPVLTRVGNDGIREGYEAAGWEADGKKALPGEHGFRFFPGFYRHLPDTMGRIPYGPNGNVLGNLVVAKYLALGLSGRPLLIVRTQLPRTLHEFVETLLLLFMEQHEGASLGLRRKEVEFFANRMWQILTSCRDRRFACYEDLTWSEFLDADNRKYSDAYRNLLVNGLSRSLLANDPVSGSARTIGNTNIQLFFDMAKFGGHVDRLLNGPTSWAWLDPWRKYLQGESDKRLPGALVTFHMGAEATQIACADGRVSSVVVRQGRDTQQVTGDIYVFCLPVERMAALLEQSRRPGNDQDPLKLDPTLEPICGWLKSCVGQMNGIQFFLKKDVPIVEGHCLLVDSPWALTGLSQMQFWQNVDIGRCDDGQVRGIISLCISQWTEPVPVTGGKPRPPQWNPPPLVQVPRANESSREDIRRHVWAQLKQSVNYGEVQLADSDLHSWFLDPDVVDDPSSRGLYTDLEPLFVNKAGTWDKRPQAVTKIPNFFLASDYVQTYTDVACMEAANEAARRAVNGILDACGSDAPRCKLWDLHEPDVFEPYRREDQRRFDAGLPWNGELGPSGWAGEAPRAKFVERGGMQCHLQPFYCDDITMFGFFIEGSMEKLQVLVDRSLNKPTGGATDYRVVSPLVMVTFAYVAKGGSTQEPDKSMGYIPETSCTLWITTVAFERGKAQRPAMFVPYIVVDNAWSMAAGREIYGFPKEIGTFEMPKGIDDATRFSVATTVLPKFSTDTLATVKPLIEIERSDNKPPKLARDAIAVGIESLLGELAAGVLNAAGELPSHVLDDFKHQKVPAAFLKQFRDVVDGRDRSALSLVSGASGRSERRLSPGGRVCVHCPHWEGAAN